MIALIDYEAGNIRSVANALNRLGVEFELTSDHQKIRQSEKVIFPGVGHAESAMNALARKGLDQLIPSLTQPVLGICVGMQLLCARSSEGPCEGLGLVDATVTRFEFDHLKVPHMGWNTISTIQSSPLFNGIEPGSYFYFVHSYYVPDNQYAIASCTYGNEAEDQRFCAALRVDNFYGIQFHAEKSGQLGSQLLKNFIEII